MHHIDAIGFIKFPIKDMAENTIISGDKILSFSLHDNMGAFRRFNCVDCDDVNRTLREALIAVFQCKTRLCNVKWFDFMGNINNGR